MHLELDKAVSVLIVKVGHYPLHHGGVAVIRTLGRLGVAVYAVTEDRFTPAAVSRYLRGRFVWPTTGTEEPQQLVDGLLALGNRVSGRVIALPTDDEAAVLLAEHAGRLGERYEYPRVPAALPRTLADKFTLHQLCMAQGIPTATSARPASVEQLFTDAGEIGYPVVLKNAEPWLRLSAPAVGATTVVRSESDLRSLTDTWAAMPQVLVQEYLRPGGGTQDWISQMYCDASSTALVTFTGVKVRSWPPGAGVTTRAHTVANPELAEMTEILSRNIGYRGIGDLDWRFDAADGRYKLLDFNPRVGAQFRLFVTDSGVDVVRAMHLDLTGRCVPPGHPVEGHGLRVENLDLAAVWAARGSRGLPALPATPGKTELAWLATDDLRPAAVAAVRSGAPTVGLAKRVIRRRAGEAVSRYRATKR